MKNLLPLLTILLASIFLTACEDEPKTPFEVTQAFWYAVENKNIDQIKQLISEKSLRDEYLADNIISVSETSFGKIVIDGDIAEVETTVVVESDNPTTVPIDTLLVKENEKWKVDYHATVDAIGSGGQLAQVIRELRVFGEKFSRDFSKEFESSMDELDKAMPEIEKEISNLSDQIKEHVPELKKQFEELAKQLQEALEESLSEEQAQDAI